MGKVMTFLGVFAHKSEPAPIKVIVRVPKVVPSEENHLK